MIDLLRPIFARIIGAIIGALAAWLAGRFGIVVPEETKGQLTQGAVALMLLVFGVVYSLVHKGVSVKTNPADAASPGLALKGKTDQHSL